MKQGTARIAHAQNTEMSKLSSFTFLATHTSAWPHTEDVNGTWYGRWFVYQCDSGHVYCARTKISRTLQHVSYGGKNIAFNVAIFEMNFCYLKSSTEKNGFYENRRLLYCSILKWRGVFWLENNILFVL